MFDDSEYKQTTIRFKNKAGETVVLKNVPAFYYDAGVLLYEMDDMYLVCGYQIDQEPYYDWAYWFKLNMTCGAGIQLRERRRHSKQHFFNEECGYGEPERDDYFFMGGLETASAKAHCIQKPEWAYKWIDCYEHSGCAYSESGTGMQCRFDTSDNVGVWYLSEQLINDITAEMQRKIEETKKSLKPGEELDISKFEEERDAEIQKYFLHDMAMLSDTDAALCIIHAVYYKKDLQDDPDAEAEEETYEAAIYEGVTFPYGDGDKYLLNTEGYTHIPYEILEEETKNPWP